MDEKNMKIEKDIAVLMRDGVRLFANIYRPNHGKRYPVVLSATPYGKDNAPDRFGMFFMRLSGRTLGNWTVPSGLALNLRILLFWVGSG